jgi:stress response protein YsnF
MATETEAILHNMASEATFKDGTKMWVLNKRYKQSLEAAQTIKISLEFERLNDQRNTEIMEELHVRKTREDV